ncbi:MAG: hypothetical protein O3C57_06220 [Verrucomicrobia bacterium]|nr:hypothetical protein [Verrucomicrobiota bacterium]
MKPKNFANKVWTPPAGIGFTAARSFGWISVANDLCGHGTPEARQWAQERIVPQDGDTKQDREIKAGKRWLDKNGAFYNTGNDTILGDDLYAHQPFCRRTLQNKYHFIFNCKPKSHKYLYQWLEPLEEVRISTPSKCA